MPGKIKCAHNSMNFMVFALPPLALWDKVKLCDNSPIFALFFAVQFKCVNDIQFNPNAVKSNTFQLTVKFNKLTQKHNFQLPYSRTGPYE